MMVETIDQAKIHDNYRDVSRESEFAIDVNADVEDAFGKMSMQERLVCCDFSNGKRRVEGILTRSDIKKAYVNHKLEGKVSDIMNRDFSYTTMANLENDVGKLRQFFFLPVVDEERNFLFMLDRRSCHAWADAQDFEINWWRDYYETRSKLKSLSVEEPDKTDKTLDRLDGMLLPPPHIRLIREKLQVGSVCVEMGAGPVLGYTIDIPDKNRRVVIEPLCEKYAALREEYGEKLHNESGIEYYAQGADVYIPELENTADLLLLMNMLDHTPEWPFVLGNAASYARKGGLLYIANDIDHHSESIKGHFNITYNPEKFVKLIEQLGFDIIWKKYWTTPHGTTIVSCFARKR